MSQTPRKVLIVSPHFPPINAPDMQRARLALPYLRANGWEPVVLAVGPEMVEGGVVEPLLEDTYPPYIRIVRVSGIPPRATRWIGFGSLWLRCGPALRAAGERLLKAEKFDLVFFSTTQFDAFTLGPIWKSRFGVPYVLDYQDPWINDYYARTGTRPPGGWLKFSYSQWCARRREPDVLRNASGVITVSAAYGSTLAKTYPWFDALNATVLTFGAAKEDLITARKHRPADPIVTFGDGLFHHVYTGRCGPDMSISLSIAFRAFKLYLAARPDEARRVRFHFIGTDYAPRPLGREWVMPVARAEGVGDFVTEHCYRVPYFDALYYLINADALLGVGSNDPTYSASKIYPYVLAMRPMLLIFNYFSPILAIASKVKCGLRIAFEDSSDLDSLAQEIADKWFLKGGMREFKEPDLEAFRLYTAEGMTRKLSECFDRALERHASTP
jgi:hypothetical protein